MTCLVCPSTIKYWEKELMELGRHKEAEDAQEESEEVKG